MLVHGAYTPQTALEAGVLDELQIGQVPVLFGGGHLSENGDAGVELEIVRGIDTPEATHIRYRVRRWAGRPAGLSLLAGRDESTGHGWARTVPLSQIGTAACKPDDQRKLFFLIARQRSSPLFDQIRCPQA